MDILNAAYITEQNKIASSGAWIRLLEIATAGLTPVTLYYANNNEVVSWGGEQYQPISFSMDDVSFSTSGVFPEYKLSIGDVALNSDLRTRIKSNSGLVGSTIRLMVVHSDHLDLTTPAIDETAEILNCELTAEAVIFTVGIPSLLSRRFPKDRYVPGFCRHKFGLALCQYVQSSFSLTSIHISFGLGVAGIPGEQYNTIRKSNGRLIEDLFKNAPGAYDFSTTPATWDLDSDTVFTISGSLHNDGWFIANNFHTVADTYVRVFMEADKARPFVEEAAGELITMQLGYNDCDHTLEACKLRNNTQNYGGSPGIAGGVYG